MEQMDKMLVSEVETARCKELIDRVLIHDTRSVWLHHYKDRVEHFCLVDEEFNPPYKWDERESVSFLGNYVYENGRRSIMRIVKNPTARNYRYACYDSSSTRPDTTLTVTLDVDIEEKTYEFKLCINLNSALAISIELVPK